MTKEMCYQKKNSEESIKDVIPVRQVTSPTKSHYFQQHLYEIVQDENTVEDLKEKIYLHDYL